MVEKLMAESWAIVCRLSALPAAGRRQAGLSAGRQAASRLVELATNFSCHTPCQPASFTESAPGSILG